jgi:hypothetical protein
MVMKPKKEDIRRKLEKWLQFFIWKIILFRLTKLLKIDNELKIKLETKESNLYKLVPKSRALPIKLVSNF